MGGDALGFEDPAEVAGDGFDGLAECGEDHPADAVERVLQGGGRAGEVRVAFEEGADELFDVLGTVCQEVALREDHGPPIDVFGAHAADS